MPQPSSRRLAAVAACMAFVAVDGALAATPCLDAASTGGTKARPELDGVLAISVTDRAELVLADGHTVLPAGIVFPDEAVAAAAMRAALDVGEVSLAAISRRPDRWGRHRAALVAEDDDTPAVALAERPAFAERLVAEGAALLNPDDVAPVRGRSDGTGLPVSAACADRLAALEKAARRDRRGLWRGTDAMPLDARDTERLQRSAGRFVVVEGTVVSVGERKAATFLNFSHDWRNDFSVMIARKDWDKMATQGLTAARLTGKRVAARGEILLREGAGEPRTRAPMLRVSTARGVAYTDSD